MQPVAYDTQGLNIDSPTNWLTAFLLLSLQRAYC